MDLALSTEPIQDKSMSNSNDLRYKALRKGLEQLNTYQLWKVLTYNNSMVFDTWNYEEETGRY